ncbi:helix-turn-helix domain-containing protein [Sphingobium sufflavum]|uniref:helix-turn-helix domain-containing protein n=1 Tax=Sphingobium sufflavum TaxID=1129547 RepID=UPI001F1994E1|nr:helix-turn-helix domain-containing protein [Sphingobium sufflavum]MCE7796413.1 helix-turn-helix domain-containing protein [Sphingobium sufflavum]
MKRPGEKRSVSRSATRALDVLELFGGEGRWLRAKEIGDRLSLSSSSINQLLKTMVDSGHLVFNIDSKAYLPSPRLLTFAGWLGELYQGHSGLHQLVAMLQERTSIGVTLTAPNDLFMQIVDLATAPGDTAERGLQISMFGSAIGSAYLSTLADADIVRLAQRARIESGPIALIMEGVRQIRQDGFADGPSGDGAIWSIAMPLPLQGPGYSLILALAGAAGEVRDRRDLLLATMRDAISEWQGG